MPKEVKLTLYTFDELPTVAAKKRAIEWARGQELDWGEHDNRQLTEDFKSRLEEVGLPGGNVQWRVAFSQGDGVAFYGPVDVDRFFGVGRLKGEGPVTERKRWVPASEPYAKLRKYGFSATIVELGSGHYHHYNTMDVEWELSDPPEDEQEYAAVGKLAQEAADEILEKAKEMSHELYDDASDQILDAGSDENIGETLSANEYLFTKDGRFYGHDDE